MSQKQLLLTHTIPFIMVEDIIMRLQNGLTTTLDVIAEYGQAFYDTISTMI